MRKRFGTVALGVALQVCSAGIVVFGSPTPASAVGTYDNANIAKVALSYVGRNGSSACVDAGKSGGDQCKQFANCVVYMVSGKKQYPVDPNGNYQNSYVVAGGVEVSSANASIGDVIQYGETDADAASGRLHTAIVVVNRGSGKFSVVDANFKYDGIVRQHEYTPPSGTRFWRMGTVIAGSSNGSSSLPGTGASPIRNGGFNAGAAYWNASGAANFARYEGGVTAPYEGTGYLATNSSQAGGNVFQQSEVATPAGGAFCASAQVVTLGAGSGGAGTMVLWLIGGNSNESSQQSFTSLPGNSEWRATKTCVTATTSHTHIKVEIFPAVGGPTIGVDAVDVHKTLNTNAGFNFGSPYWFAWPGTNTNIAAYRTGQNATSPYEGSAFLATNTSTAGGGIYQDIPKTITPGEEFCVDAELTTADGKTGASGMLALWLVGGGGNEMSSFTYNNLPGNNTWTHAKACVMATTMRGTLRVQLYPTAGSPTVGIDAVDLHTSLTPNGGINGAASYWTRSGNLDYARYSRYGNTLPYEGAGLVAVYAPQAGASLWQQTVPRAVAAGDSLCAEASVVTAGASSGGEGSLTLWILGGSAPYSSSYYFKGLSGANNWSRVKTCVTANEAINGGIVKVEVYPKPGSPILAIDAVDVH